MELEFINKKNEYSLTIKWLNKKMRKLKNEWNLKKIVNYKTHK